jgi:hypothetical protein
MVSFNRNSELYFSRKKPKLPEEIIESAGENFTSNTRQACSFLFYH